MRRLRKRNRPAFVTTSKPMMPQVSSRNGAPAASSSLSSPVSLSFVLKAYLVILSVSTTCAEINIHKPSHTSMEMHSSVDSRSSITETTLINAEHYIERDSDGNGNGNGTGDVHIRKIYREATNTNDERMQMSDDPEIANSRSSAETSESDTTSHQSSHHLRSRSRIDSDSNSKHLNQMDSIRTSTSTIVRSLDDNDEEEIGNGNVDVNGNIDDNGNGNESAESEPNAKEKFIKTFFGWFLVGIAGLSLLGWAYIFYMRRQYNKQIKEEELQHAHHGHGKASCCQNNGSDVFPIKLNTPPRSPGAAAVEWDDNYHKQPGNGNGGNGNGSKFLKNQRQPNHHRINTNVSNSYNLSMMSPAEGSVSASSFGHSSFDVSMSRGEVDDGEEDDDSFARELQVAARADQHTWVQHRGRQKAIQAKKKFVPSLRPSTKDVEHVTEQFANFDDGFGHNNTNNKNTNSNINKNGNRQQEDRLGFIGSMSGSGSRQEGDGIEMMHRGQLQMQASSPPMSYLPTSLRSSQSRFQNGSQYQPNGNVPNSMRKNHVAPENYNRRTDRSGFRQHQPQHHQGKQMHNYQQAYQRSNKSQDVGHPPDRVLTSDSSATPTYSSATDSSYAGKNSSVEEGDHSGNGFEVVDYLNGPRDGMDAYLLNPIPAGDDDSFGNSSGMEMSLGTNTQASVISSEATQGTLQGRGSVSRGFFVIDGDNDMTDEYIPKDEYNAAVRAAASVLENSPRNSPQKSRHGSQGRFDRFGNHLNSYPSDERSGFAPSRPNRFPSDERTRANARLNAQYDSEGYSLSVDESSSFDPTAVHSSSVDNSSDPALSNEIFKELKSVSNFIRRYEKKQSKEEKNENWKMETSNNTIDLSQDTNTFHSSSSQPSLMHTSASETDSRSKGERKMRFPTFSRKKKGYVQESDFSDLEVNVKSKKKKRGKNIGRKQYLKNALPPRHTHLSVPSRDNDEDDEEDDDVVMMPNPRRQRRQLPVAGNGEYPGIGVSPSGESGASDAKFLRNEIESFFSHKDTSASVMSESIEVLHRPSTNNFKSEVISQQSREKAQMDSSYGNDSTFATEYTTEETGEFNRLGAAPFNPRESPIKRSPLPDTVSISPGSRRGKTSKRTTPLASSKHDTERLYPEATPPQTGKTHYDSSYDSSQVPIAQSARTILQSGAQSIAMMLDRNRQSPKEDSSPNLGSGAGSSKRSISKQQFSKDHDHQEISSDPPAPRTQGQISESKMHSGAKSLLSLFDASSDSHSGPLHFLGENTFDNPSNKPNNDRNITSRISNRLEQIRRNVNERRANNISPSPRNGKDNENESTRRTQQSDHSPRTSRSSKTNNDYNEGLARSKKVQVATFIEPEEMNIISPSNTIGVRRERKPGRLLRPGLNISQQSGDDTTEGEGSRSQTNTNTPDRGSVGGSGRQRQEPKNEINIGHEGSSPRFQFQKTVPAVSKASSNAGSVNSNARNLISMFESNRSNNNAIFPPGENWQSGIVRKKVSSPNY